MSRFEDEEVKDNPLQCLVCERVCDPSELLTKCPACGKRFCEFCVFRVGGREYCSRSCGIRYFFASDDEDGASED